MFTEKLRELRTINNMTQKELAQKLGLDYKRYNHYETGRSEPDNKVLMAIADCFGVSTDYLLGRDKKKSAPKDGDGLTKEQAEIVRLFESAPPALRAAALAVLRSAEGQDKAPGGVSKAE